MKKKILFPLLYLVLLVLSLSFALGGLLFVLIALVSLVLLVVEVNSGFGPAEFGGDGIYPVFVLGIVQWFLVGILWDAVANYFKNKKYNGD